MSREIKFRAWCKQQDCYEGMFYNVQEAYDHLKEIPAQAFSDFFDDEIWVLMQFTGLKDNNGKEIYEGDIVQSIFNPNPSRHPADDNVSVFLIKWSDEAAMFVAEDCSGYESDLELGNYIHDKSIQQIIGNIYENPELLRG